MRYTNTYPIAENISAVALTGAFQIFEANSGVAPVIIHYLNRPTTKEIEKNNITIFAKKSEENENENQAATPLTSFAFMDPVSGTLQKLFQVV